MNGYSLASRPPNGHRSPFLDLTASLSDLTRCRLLQLLVREELQVSELCRVTQLPQSTVSRHLKVLADSGWIRSRRDGTRHLYQLLEEDLAEAARRLWDLVREQTASDASSAQDLRRLQAVLADRSTQTRAFFAETAGQWDALRNELFGPRFDLLALLALLDPAWTVGDLACGTGSVAAKLAPFVRQVIAIDGSAAMLDAAAVRLQAFANVELLPGELESLPIDESRLDLATLFLALHHVAEPVQALREVRRILKPGATIAIVDMAPHDREEYRSQMGHVWLGFSAERLERFLRAAGLTPTRYQALALDPGARGPSLFVALARRNDQPDDEERDAPSPTGERA